MCSSQPQPLPGVRVEREATAWAGFAAEHRLHIHEQEELDALPSILGIVVPQEGHLVGRELEALSSSSDQAVREAACAWDREVRMRPGISSPVRD